MMHEMLAGRSPFDDVSIEGGKEQIYARVRAYARGGRTSAAEMMNTIINEDGVPLSPSAGDFLLGLLTPAEEARLGCTTHGFDEVEHHEWFHSMDWVALIRQEVPAPWVPAAQATSDSCASDAGTQSATPPTTTKDEEMSEIENYLAGNSRDAPYDADLWRVAFDGFGTRIAGNLLASLDATEAAAALRLYGAPVASSTPKDSAYLETGLPPRAAAVSEYQVGGLKTLDELVARASQPPSPHDKVSTGEEVRLHAKLGEATLGEAKLGEAKLSPHVSPLVTAAPGPAGLVVSQESPTSVLSQ